MPARRPAFTTAGPTPGLPPAPISVPVRAYYAARDKNVKRHHVDGWKRLLAAGTPFSVDEVGGNHLFFYDVPVRAAWMEAVVRGLPFGA